MNYYEELGIRSDADEEEIRKAHRRLVKLMHPDQHRDQGLKQLAETQMRRLNSVVATLLDPEERREYDEQLRGADSHSQTSHQSTWRSVPWWIASTLGAIVLTVGAVYFFADHIGSSFNTHNPPQVENLAPADKGDVTTVQVPAITPPAKLPSTQPDTAPLVPARPVGGSGENPAEPVASVPVPSPEKPKPVVVKAPLPFPAAPIPDKTRDNAKILPPPKPLNSLPSHPVVTKPKEEGQTASRSVPPPVVALKAPNPPRDAEIRKLKDVPVVTARVPVSTTLDASLRPPSVAAATIPAGFDIPPNPGNIPPPVARGSRDPLEGEWVYAPTEPEKRKPGFYSPEFIQLRLTKDTSGMRGEYSARYNIADNRPVSPDVNFVLKATDPKALHYVWTAADGSKGWFVIRSLEPDTMRLEWKATSSRSSPALSSGMATLVRKN